MTERENYIENILLSEKSNEEQIKLYYEISATFDKLCEDVNYHFPELLANELQNFNLPRESKILDVGAGTGRLGKALHSLNYTNIDALDACETMLDQARKLPNVYKKFMHAAVVEDTELAIPENAYDVVLMSGSTGPVHIDVAAYKQIIRIVKPGGLIGWITEDPITRAKVSSKFRDNIYENALKKFVDEKLWVPVEGYNPKEVADAVLSRPGDVFFYKVL